MSSGTIKWIVIGVFVVAFFVVMTFVFHAFTGFLILMGMAGLVAVGQTLYLKHPAGTLLGFLLLVILFVLGMRISQKIHPVSANATPRQAMSIIVDGQDTIIPMDAKDKNTGESLPTFVPGDCVSSNFPDSIRQWCPFIEASAKKHNLDPKLIAAVMLQESGGDPHAGAYISTVDGVDYHVSADGAVGLLQVMPKDGLAQIKYGSMFANRKSCAELYDPATNIEAGTALLAGYINRYGSVRDGLFHYGPYGCGYECYADKILSIYNNY